MTIAPSRFLLCCLLLVGGLCRAQTSFENENGEQLERNPSGVNVVLRTTDGRLTFHLFETIPIELVFQSSHPSAYSIELDELMNFAGQANWFQVSPVETVFLTSPLVAGVSCCAMNRHYLSPEPRVLKRELTDHFRFESPGVYSIYYSTNRVFRGLGKKNDFGNSPLTLTSNVLTLTILRDDPQWDAQQLADTLKKLEDPEVRASYERAMQHARKLSLESETAGYFYIQNQLVTYGAEKDDADCG